MTQKDVTALTNMVAHGLLYNSEIMDDTGDKSHFSKDFFLWMLKRFAQKWPAQNNRAFSWCPIASVDETNPLFS